MSGTRCERCGTLVAAGRVVCPRCDNVVDLSFLGEQTRAELDDDDGWSPIDAPTLTTTTQLARATTSSSDADTNDAGDANDANDANDVGLPTLPVPRPGPPAGEPQSPEVLTTPQRPRAQLTEPEPLAETVTPATATRPAARETFLEEPTDADLSDLSELLRSSTDALVLGDAGDVVESLWVEQSLTSPEAEQLALVQPLTARATPAEMPSPRDDVDFLTAPTIEGRRDIVPVQVYIGADIARVIEKDAVLERNADAGAVLVSTFEQYVLDQIDGVRPVARIQKRMGLTDGDLRIALALLVDKKLVQRRGRATVAHVPGVPTMAVAPAAITIDALDALDALDAGGSVDHGPFDVDGDAATPATQQQQQPEQQQQQQQRPPMQPGRDAGAPGVVRAELVVDDAGRSRAAALHAQCLRDLKNGAVARSYALARMAHEAAPDVERYREIVDDWNAFVSAHKTADDARLHAQAVNAETVGDAARAVTLLQQAAKANPHNAAVWNRLGLLLATRMQDIDGALEAMTKAIELAPDDATFKNNFGKIAALAERRGGPSSSKGGIFQKLFRR